MPPIVQPPAPDNIAKAAREQAVRPYLLEIAKNATDLGIMALKTVILLNGAAAISLLALAGQIWDDHALASRLVEAIRQFVMGTFAGGIASALAFASTWFFSFSVVFVVKSGSGRASQAFLVVGFAFLLFAVVCGIYGFVRFGIGATVASHILAKA